MEHLSSHGNSQMAADSSVILQELLRLVELRAKIQFTKTGGLGPSEFEGEESGELEVSWG